jgi:glycosyltransferase involved in cell wall biosynthesis
MNISFLSSGHLPFDDRIFYHLGKTLSDAGHKVQIASSKAELKDSAGEISLNCFEGDDLAKRNKINRFTQCLEVFSPDIIICSEPLTIIAAKNYSRKHSGKTRIIYDITEWYPSKKNLSPFKPVFRFLIFLKLLVFNIYATRLADAFIFGEWYKSRPYRFLFPKKPYKFITYYPELKYIKYNEPTLADGRLKLCYSGKISLEKGFGNFINVLKELTKYNTNLNIEVKIIGWYESPRDKQDCEVLFQSVKDNITFSFSDRMPFITFWESVNDTDIFLDLRSDSPENRYSLPIKLFYYAALGRPVIFSDLKAIRREVETGNFGFLVKPDKPDRIVQIISCYLQNKQLYYTHCRNARRASEEYYNWQKISPRFLTFIDTYPSF